MSKIIPFIGTVLSVKVTALLVVQIVSQLSPQFEEMPYFFVLQC